jgi:hypothetical protein
LFLCHTNFIGSLTPDAVNVDSARYVVVAHGSNFFVEQQPALAALLHQVGEYYLYAGIVV